MPQDPFVHRPREEDLDGLTPWERQNTFVRLAEFMREHPVLSRAEILYHIAHGMTLVACMTLCLIMTGAGVIASAQDARPGDVLYPMKSLLHPLSRLPPIPPPPAHQPLPAAARVTRMDRPSRGSGNSMHAKESGSGTLLSGNRRHLHIIIKYSGNKSSTKTSPAL